MDEFVKLVNEQGSVPVQSEDVTYVQTRKFVVNTYSLAAGGKLVYSIERPASALWVTLASGNELSICLGEEYDAKSRLIVREGQSVKLPAHVNAYAFFNSDSTTITFFVVLVNQVEYEMR